MAKYCIVEFVEEGSVELVPSNWITGNKCSWPPGPGDKTHLIKKRQPPGREWKMYKVAVKGAYDRYEDGRRKVDLAQYTSDLDSGQELKKRRIQRPTRYDDEDVRYSAPTPPLSFPRASTSHSPRNDTPDEDDAALSTVSDTIIDDISDIQAADESVDCGNSLRKVHSSASLEIDQERTKQQQQPTRTNRKALPPGEFQHEVLTRLTALRMVLQQQSELLTALSMKCTKDSVILEEGSVFKDQFDDIAALQRFDASLTEATKGSLVRYLSSIGGVSPESCTRRILRTLMSDRVAAEFSWQGKKGKHSFCNLNVSRCIIAAVKSTRKCSDYTIESAIKDWLRHAPARTRDTSQSSSAKGSSNETSAH
ncbi:uncharacterized protein LOC135374669 [Ornithodoros turicata]|uniref:uncharacterized protein LOC135374669 n=1 Tax=Ornithodoros turicata TaxID=34597 RepID=UPI003138E004